MTTSITVTQTAVAAAHQSPRAPWWHLEGWARREAVRHAVRIRPRHSKALTRHMGVA